MRRWKLESLGRIRRDPASLTAGHVHRGCGRWPRAQPDGRRWLL